MQNVLHHYVTLDPRLISHNWHYYQIQYKALESNLPGFFSIQSPFSGLYSIDPLLGFRLSSTQVTNPETIKSLRLNERKFFLKHNGEIFSRGLEYYPALFKDLSQAQQLEKTIDNTLLVLNFLDSDYNMMDPVFRAALLDYVRNYMLIIYQSFLSLVDNTNDYEKVIPPHIENIDNDLKRAIFGILCVFYSNLLGVSGAQELKYSEIIESVEEFQELVKDNYLNDLSDKKIVRESREIDSVAHVYLFCKEIASHRFSEDSCLIGIRYGGIELPFSVNAIRHLQHKRVLPVVCFNVTNYSSSGDKCASQSLLITSHKKILSESNSFMILDDSVSTGRSINGVLSLLPSHTKAAYAGFVTFKVSNRLHHLAMKHHGGINPHIVKGSVVLCKANYSSTYKNNSYLSKAGLFNHNKHLLYSILGAN